MLRTSRRPALDNIVCPDCLAAGPEFIGKLPSVALFAGRALEQQLDGGALLQCSSCSLKFRHVPQGQPITTSMYDNSLTDAWEASSNGRVEWTIIRSLIKKRPDASLKVLDVGCYTGGFLRSLDGDFAKAGVEPNANAAAIARKTADADVWPSVLSIPDGKFFDVITATDVLEHVERPAEFIIQLSRHLESDGVLILSTGDGSATFPKMFGANWWYWYFPEHISFVSLEWFKHFCKNKKFSLTYSSSFFYNRLAGLTRYSDLLQTIGYGVMGKIYLWIVGLLYRMLGRQWAVYPKGMGVSKDHFIMMIQKINS